MLNLFRQKRCHFPGARRTTAAIPWRFWFATVMSLLFLTAIIYGLVSAWYYAQKPNSFPIKQIQIQGKLSHVDPTRIQAIVRKQLVGGFFSLKLSPVKKHLLAMPWIVGVSFRRRWPGMLAVNLTEQKAVAQWKTNGVVNPQGMIFYPNVKTIPNNLPVFDGPVDQVRAMLTFYHKVNARAKTLGLFVTQIDLSDSQEWGLHLSNHVEVILGRQHMMLRFERLISVYPKIEQSTRRRLARIDLRYPNGFAVEYQQGSRIKKQTN